MNKKSLSWFTLASFLVVLAVNYLMAIGFLPFLSPQKEVSKLYETPITPAGFTFSIWAVIYGLLLIAILWMIKDSSGRYGKSDFIGSILPFVLAVFVFNLSWNFAFGLEWIGVSCIMIFGYWLSLLIIGFKLKNAKIKLNPIVALAFGIHTGWISIASVVNFFAFLVKSKSEGITNHPELWAIFGIAFTVILIFVLQFLLKNASLPLATGWAFFGIYMKEGVTYSAFGFIPILLLAAAGLMLFFAVTTFVKNGNALLPN